MSSPAVSGDSLYAVSWRPSFGATDGGPVGHVVVRRLDDDAEAALLPVGADGDPRELLSRVETSLRGPATAFEDAWGIGDAVKADPGPEQGWVPEAYRARDDVRGPDHGVVLTAPDPRVRVFPDPSGVFATDQAWLADVLRPVLAVTVGDGEVPLLCPVFREDGLLGESSRSVHTTYTGVNWISFRLDDDGRLRFLGDRGYFAGGSEVAPEFHGTDLRGPELHGHGGTTDGPVPLVDRWGGEPGYGNWSDVPPPSAFRLDRSDPASPVLRLVDGRPFTFVAATAGHRWREDAADGILLFVEPETRTLAFTFDWS